MQLRPSFKPTTVAAHYEMNTSATALSRWGQEGSLTLNGKSPLQWGVPQWRAQVTYVPQTRVSAKGTPSELYFSAQASPCIKLSLTLQVHELY